LTDRYTSRSGAILLTGVQALVRLLLVRADLDRTAGLHTGGFVSGYRGSPLGTLDRAFENAGSLIGDAGIVVRPAVNEEMAATAITGTQQIAQSKDAKVEGVFSLWYGKGPGLDRAADAIRHGNQQGASRKGGVVMAIGDDHLAKSSSVVCASEDVVAALLVPLFYPADAQEVIEFGLHGFALSRHTGSWAALKILPEVADATHAAVANEMAFRPVLPAIEAPPIGLHNQWPDTALDQELRHRAYRLPAVADYIRANGLDRSHCRHASTRLGILAAGKSWLDLKEALRLLGLDAARLQALGVALYKPAVIWPLEAEGLRQFGLGLDTLVVIEEKGPLLENQVKSILYHLPDAPTVVGKLGRGGAPLFPATGDLNPERIAVALDLLFTESRLEALTSGAAEILRRMLDGAAASATTPVVRKPFFCSGCPHNRSTDLPDGSHAMSGIGCSSMAAFNRTDHLAFTQMGGEGVPWVGLSPFTNDPHVFANMGDGTYFHSGLLAIRQAVAAKVNITYKLLYNSAVAMTGGQAVDGDLDVGKLVEQIAAEGVDAVVIVTDDPKHYPASDPLRAKVQRIVHRDDFNSIQQELRSRRGVSVIVYDQMCATEKRRLRKRGKLPDPATRVFINEAVCEGCGDCSVKSNCLSVEPVETPFGTKRRINQSSCNKDYSCLTGFCPSLVSIEGGTPRRAPIQAAILSDLPAPLIPEFAHQRILVAGIGGTGVVTIGALLSMSAHLTGTKASVLDQVGLAQKGGAVLSHIHLAQDEIMALRIPAGQADLILACDAVVGNAKDVLAALRPGRTKVLVNRDVAITGAFTQDRDAVPDETLLIRRIQDRAGLDNFVAHPFTRLSERLLGDSIGSNLMMVGFAFQSGWLSLDTQSFAAAIQLNGTATAMNDAAFRWGRSLAVDQASVYRAAGLSKPVPETLDEMIARRTAFLIEYQDKAYAQTFESTISKVRTAEARVAKTTRLTEAAARSLFKLMAYKDEYETARLYTNAAFTKALEAQFEGVRKIKFHLAPPLIARRDPATGHLKKQSFGPWMMTVFRGLALLKGLRGTRFDPFGYSEERRTERALITEYEGLLDVLCSDLSPTTLEEAIRIARLPEPILGYGHIKEKAIRTYRDQVREALQGYRPVPGEEESDLASRTRSA
jgi:indolepyruvate ferredoxin oxidoreductase